MSDSSPLDLSVLADLDDDYTYGSWTPPTAGVGRSLNTPPLLPVTEAPILSMGVGTCAIVESSNVMIGVGTRTSTYHGSKDDPETHSACSLSYDWRHTTQTRLTSKHLNI